MSAQELITDHLDLWTGAVTHKSGSGRSASGKNGKIELTGIKKLRELILELAVRGKLVEQDPSDEPASVLLDRIAEEKARLVKAGKIKKPKKLPEITSKDFPFKIPKNWSWVQLSRVCKLENGDRSKNYPNKASLVETGIPFVNAGHIQNHEVSTKELTFITEERFNLLRSGKFREGDILFCLRGTLGKCGVVRNLERGAIASSLIIARPFLSLLSDYILLYLKAPISERMIRKYDNGTAQPNLSGADFGRFLVPLPGKGEQLRIVEKVDELMALCDRLEQQVGDQQKAHEILVDTLLDALTLSTDAAELAEHWARVAEHFDTLFTTEASIEKLKQTILQLAVMGRLVEQSSNDEPAIHLLNRYGIEGKPYFLPGWTEVALGNLGEILGGSTPTKSNAEFWEGDIPWVSPKDMKLPVIQDSQNKVTEQALQQTALKKVPKNSLLMVVRGMILAHSFPVAISGREVTINQDMKALVVPKEISPYLLLYLQAEKSKLVGLVDRSSHGTCKLVSEKLWSHVVYLPPIEEQARIIETVDELMALCDQLKTCLSESGKTRSKLAETVVEQAVS